MRRSKTSDRYEPLVQMALDMSRDTDVPAQYQFDALLALLQGPTWVRRALWCADRNRVLVMTVALAGAALGAHFAI